MTSEKHFWRYFIEDDDNHTIKYGISKGEQPPDNVSRYDKIETSSQSSQSPHITKERVINCKSGFEYIVLLNITKNSWLNGEEEY